MKEMRRVLALLLCFVMLVGYVPVGALAAEAETTAPSVAEEPLVTEATDAVEDTTAAPEIETTASAETTEAVVETTAAVETTEAVEETTEAVEETAPAVMLTASSAAAAAVSGVLDAAIFCSDVHGSSSDLTSVMGGIKTSGVTYSAIGFVGDTCLTVAETKSAVNSGLGDTPTVMFSYASSHDTADISTNWNYSGEVKNVSKYYLVYTVRETDMETDTGADENFTTWYNGLTAEEKTLPIFIMSHRPLHERRNDNAGAAGWYTAVSAAAETSDIVFFWAHNHTGERSADTNAYYVPNDGSETITVEGGSTVGLNFTYMNAGYINANNQNPARIGVATTVQITADSLVFQDYNESGEYNGDYSHNVTVTRKNAASTPTLESIAISGGNSYTVGEELALIVTATYSDGSTEDVTDAVEWSDLPDMTTAGTYNVTATYEGLTATYTIVVADPYVTGIAITTLPTTVTFDQGDELDTNGLVVTATYNNGTTAEVTPTSFTGYDMSKAGEQTVTVNYYVNGTTWSTTYTITVNEALADDVTLVSMEITTDPTTTEYQVNDALDISGMVVTATFSDNTTKELTYGGFIDSDGTSTVASDTFCYYIDGFNMHVEKQQKVVVSYTYGDKTLTDTFVINVWNYEFKDETTGVIVDVADGDYGVTGMTVADSTNNYVSTAIADYITGTNYKAYDITLTLDTRVNSEDSYILTSDAKTVTLPIPEGVNNPVVCYVSDDGATVTNMNAVKDGKGNVTFTTTHFSTYVIGESTEITVPDNDTASGSSTTGGKKTVYVLTSSITSGNSYLIVNGNSAGSYYALANNSGKVDDTGVTVKTDDTIGTYIELDDATDELWTVASGYTFQNGSYYLGYTTSGSNWNQKYTFGLSTTSRSWSYSTSNHRLHTSIGNWNSTTYYLRYNDGWDWTSSNSESGRSVYFYVPTEIDTTTTVKGTYTITGKDISAVVASDGSTTANLTATLTLMVDDNEDVDDVVTDVSTTATYKIVTVDANGNTVDGDPKDIITKIENGVVTFTGKYGTALVKVSYDTNGDTDGGVVTDYITIEAKAPYYSIDLHKANSTVNNVTGLTAWVEGTTYYTLNEDGTYSQVDTENTAPDASVTYYYVTYTVGDEITAPIAIKGIEAGDQYGVWAVVKKFDGTSEDGTDLGSVGSAITWSSSDESVATVDPVTGIITFTGKEGTVNITADYKYDTENNLSVSDTITISASPNKYSLPADGTSDFPEYPNEGAIRYDKTATAVGNFSETGIAQVELSMTGVPYSTGSEIDVVLMLDMTGSMSDTAMTAAEEAAVAFVAQIVKNEDGTYNSNRIAVYAFNSSSSSPFELVSLETISSDAELAAANTAIRAASDKQVSGGTPYDEALEKCQSVLEAAKTDGVGNDRQQFCVFMSDGGPTSYEYITNYDAVKAGTADEYTHSSASATGGSNQSDRNFATIATYTHEYYSTLMKDDDVTMFSVLTGLSADDYPNCATILENIASSSDKAYVVENGSDTSAVSGALDNIAQQILQAATDVTVEDKITDEYTMIFDIPTGSKSISGVTNDFYIEFLKCTLDSTTHERTGESTSVTKLYLKNTNGVLSAASDSSGTAYASSVFAQTTIGNKGTLYYWSTKEADGDSGVSVTVDGITYYFVSYGMETAGYNMTSGAYAYGTVDSTTNMSEDLVIATPYFVYNASTKMLYWTLDKLQDATTEYALRYFLYLDRSATEVGTNNEVASGPYETNDHAYITYTNFNGNECRQEFPVPQMTWNGAQVSYVFYLVNAAGQPINKSGQVVDFANATFITDVFTYNVVWNDDNAVEELNVDYLADELLPDAYTVYDENAKYTIHVYQKADGSTIFDYFIIEGSAERTVNAESGTTVASDATTKVYNTKAGTKYSEYGIYSASDVGSQFTTTDADGNAVTIVTTKKAELDYSDTTVAFAVLWEPELVEDTVVVDYGLDVLINVVQNDNLQNTINGIGLGKDAYSVKMNTGVSTTSKLGTATLTTSDGSTISIENENQVRFKQNDMTFQTPVTFYYESKVEFYEGSDKLEGYMYSSVTVIPATTVYYEEDFVTLGGDAGWTTDGTTQNATQQQDRPGESQVSSSLDADNVYGYDAAYDSSSTYSMGSAAKTTLSGKLYATAEFTFYGTGFDVISMTSNDTGFITVQVTDSNGNVDATRMVDTYYGYEYVLCEVTYTYTDGAWVKTEVGEKVTAEDATEGSVPTEAAEEGTTAVINQMAWKATDSDNALYQVPVIRVVDLDYDKYTVLITAAYSKWLDHADASDTGSYDFYLDAIRIYDPTGNQNETANNAYKADKEGWPIYHELRDLVISANDFDALTAEEQTSGAIFIDQKAGTYTISDYENYGPNNELYLAPGQTIAFDLNLAQYTGPVADVQIGMKSADGTPVNVTMTSTEATTSTAKIEPSGSSATDRYYSIGGRVDLDGTTTLSFKNSNEKSGILSITNIKITFESADAATYKTESADVFTVSRASANAVLMTLNSVEEETPETEETEPEATEPEVTEPEETLDAQLKVSVMNNSVKVGSTVVVKITTSGDVDALTVNGKEIPRYTENKFTGVRTWTTTVKASEAGDMDVVVTAYNNGAALDTVTETIEVTSKTAGVVQQIVGQLIGMLFG